MGSTPAFFQQKQTNNDGQLVMHPASNHKGRKQGRKAVVNCDEKKTLETCEFLHMGPQNFLCFYFLLTWGPLKEIFLATVSMKAPKLLFMHPKHCGFPPYH